MPTYTFKCKKCGEIYSVFVPHSETERVRCPKCGEVEKERLYRKFSFISNSGGANGCSGSCGGCSGCS